MRSTAADLWVLLVLHGAALFLFTNGFFLTRYEATDVSPCSQMTAFSTTQYLRHHVPSTSGCWSNVKFPRVVYIVIDALRFDFMHEASMDEQKQKSRDGGKFFLNHMSHVHRLLHDRPAHSLLFRFVADAPTMTMQRLKGLTTGSLPTFLDIKDNMNSDEIVEDSWIKQLAALNKRIVFMGDDTWDKLYPNTFLRNHSYDSFNVKDLHTVDNGVLKHFFPELHANDWDVLIAHFLGVDHIGHTFGPNHPTMESKLHQMDAFLAEMTEQLPPDTLAVVLGDHGMSSDGNHGGASPEETGAALFLYSRNEPLHAINDKNESIYTTLFQSADEVAQVDLVPSLSLLMGLPIPFGNLGAIIPHLFFMSSSSAAFNHSEALAQVNEALLVNARQLRHYFHTTQTIRMDLPAMLDLENLFASALAASEDATEHHRLLVAYLRDGLSLARSLYTQFDLVGMGWGIALLAMSTLVVLLQAPLRSFLHIGMAVVLGLAFTSLWPLLAPRASLSWLPGAFLPRFVATAGPLSILVGFELPRLSSFCLQLNRTSLTTAVLVVLHGASLFSNSYINVQPKLLLFLSATAIVLFGFDLVAAKDTSRGASFFLLCLLFRIYVAWTPPNIVYTAITPLETILPMLGLGLVVLRVHPPSFVSYLCIWLYWFDVLPLVLPWLVYVWTLVHCSQLIALVLVFVLVLGPSSPGVVLLFLCLSYLFRPSETTSRTWGYCFLIHSFYFQSGHGNSFASLQNAAAFVGLSEFHYHTAGFLLALNTFGAFGIGVHFSLCPLHDDLCCHESSPSHGMGYLCSEVCF
ncbi:hypothetical protein AeMF1_013612 [Aphanomyces euteiches]|nr:hypothetical protein AeMF1_013612 [Aphanomyces euteiches]KAH9188978.1 hypothetical protein AeNC1_009050 [Aphanomyces euteiches]